MLALHNHPTLDSTPSCYVPIPLLILLMHHLLLNPLLILLMAGVLGFHRFMHVHS